ncbi:bifunctional methylenetetrahydrofolate dehydrogenase/methenyltetrahydrofolate cyclohydrolase FolD [Bacillus licheniformis]|jgi:methylenetetrahydrofolate dehydrogenase (NADP+)/methenyltetrahydrofolate cyclohydrolase|uniref:Bifunctional protein FolD n=5 Tax=Bacillus licheniformis TaxID=1402 RepID=FOLD_BACLD|nr:MULTISPECIES: bifunctional methylenetetrahydrofolate dehydrogenase/methenyltetrahydrofolate cyclohydrolase FolD [Bacillus]Q65HI8.1 RecName: Full=Bifunctional protein FolD; Includes: RecName: Full=Methylenetetrahydrofolate dehydrogenase; Includes: RecName: Full=Methenyltetrahydrofolate cyclohydrolase [Bacillus licheniformis DSM 13 = ATCC 14580]MBJ7883765.1 bifunctional methylenetetrahydrofolate dehydrogenase/methenyltetrahydrofolate cyclohydrolase FolD [Bacillaceae bacterium HSR45]MBY8347150.1
MTATIIDGKETAKEKRGQLAKEVEELKKQGVTPGLAVILIGDDPASLSYVRGKKKAAEAMGIRFQLDHFDASFTEQELLEVIDQYNQNDDFHGILVQLPLPDHISEQAVIERISPEKDVDGFHPLNVGKMLLGEDTFLPCTPAGIVELLKKTEIDLSGKEVVVVGRSNIVGKPVGQLLLNENATVTYCHSRTADITAHTKKADILIVAVGKANFIKADQIKEGAVVIDVGVNRLDNGKLAGDVDFEEAKEKASYITPVPGGVGPMTITMLAHNTVKSAKRTIQL